MLRHASFLLVFLLVTINKFFFFNISLKFLHSILSRYNKTIAEVFHSSTFSFSKVLQHNFHTHFTPQFAYLTCHFTQCVTCYTRILSNRRWFVLVAKLESKYVGITHLFNYIIITNYFTIFFHCTYSCTLWNLLGSIQEYFFQRRCCFL